MLDPDKKCPECDKPNQFGEMCEGCEAEFNRIEMAEEAFNASLIRQPHL